jgi:hypothetical protein
MIKVRKFENFYIIKHGFYIVLVIIYMSNYLYSNFKSNKT